MARYVNAEKIEQFLHREDWQTPDERWRPESEFGAFIDSLPDEDVAPVVHAHWNETHFLGIYQCSACKSEVKMDTGRYAVYLKRFCPDCGAKMDKEETEQNKKG